MPDYYQIRVCLNPVCGLRYPLTGDHPFGLRCPACMGETSLVIQSIIENEPVSASNIDSLLPIEALLDNVRSAWNVGSMFRTADGFGLRQLHLCGITPTPESRSVAKTGLGAQETIPWKYHKNALNTVRQLKENGYFVIALEHDERAIPIEKMNSPKREMPVLLIAGNEITGIDPGLLDVCDQIVYLPMRGGKRSFNVSVAFGIAIMFLRYKFG
jgi:23S rRNA (guanosine2251-2'-O)-methyltransferase